jgi:7-carboxy-7-deazaguanine synthase
MQPGLRINTGMTTILPPTVKQLIRANPAVARKVPSGEPYLDIAEFFCDSIQGENFIGWPSSFLRLQHCTLNCIWCDTQRVWREGNPYTFEEVFSLMEDPQYDLIRKFREGQHLILTGGSPLRQQRELISFFDAFSSRYAFIPFIEIENECTIIPEVALSSRVKLWNNSPKLSHSGNPKPLRYRPEVIKHLASLENAWFKFVIAGTSDWDEIQQDFIDTGLISKNQVVLMPLANSREELHQNRHMVVEMAISHNVRYCSREHVALWDVLTGA